MKIFSKLLTTSFRMRQSQLGSFKCAADQANTPGLPSPSSCTSPPTKLLCIQELYEAFDGKDQSEENRLLSVRATRHLLNTNAQHTADKASVSHTSSQSLSCTQTTADISICNSEALLAMQEYKLLLSSKLVHTLWQEAAAATQARSDLQDFLSDDELQVQALQVAFRCM